MLSTEANIDVVYLQFFTEIGALSNTNLNTNTNTWTYNVFMDI